MGDTEKPFSIPNVEWRQGKPHIRLVIHDGPGGRVRIPVPHCQTENEIRERRELLVSLTARLQDAGQTDIAVELLKKAGAREGKALEGVLKAADAVCTGAAVKKKTVEAPTFKEFAESWTSGELSRQYRDHVKEKKSADVDVGRLGKYVYPVIGDVPITMIGIDQAHRVLQKIPAVMSRATRRHVAQLMHRVLQLAVYPARIILANPLPKGFLPKPGSGKAKDYLHPDEETLLLGCCRIPLVRRVFWGTLVREGMRREEAVGLDWCHLDLDHGQVRLDSNKTDDPRAWALSPDVVIALKQWRNVQGQVEASDPVFVGTNGERLNVQHAADQLRADLQTAGVTRAELFESSAHRQALRAHDLRATFITVSIATGKSEAWISDRTGHKSSQMIHRYYRQARTFTELGLGSLSPMNEAIPEFVAQKWPSVGPANSNAAPSAFIL